MTGKPAKLGPWQVAALCVAALIAWGVEHFRQAPARREAAAGTAEILQAYRGGRSGVMVESSGRVSRVLADDREGSRHQRFVVALDPGHSILIAHNIDLAPRAPVKPDDEVSFRGQYEWNDQGGVVHWTHRDPDGRHPPGWIRHEGRVYQ